VSLIRPFCLNIMSTNSYIKFLVHEQQVHYYILRIF